MWPMFQVVPIMWRALRPSKISDMPAVVNPFWLRKGYEGLTFFGTILTPSQKEADGFNSSYNSMKNHEMIHLRQAQSCHDSWLCFYLLYIWYWLKIACFGSRSVHRQLKHAAYLLNPFEMEAYCRMYDLDYLKRCEGGAEEWRIYAKMPLQQRLQIMKKGGNSSV